VNDPASRRGVAPDSRVDKTMRYYKRDFWSKENLNYSQAHYRLEKSARIINRLARGQECTLLDVGCGPATLERLLSPFIQYFGIDIAIQTAAPNLIESDFLEAPIRFGDRRFDIILAQGLFEYVGDFQLQKFTEIAQLLSENGTFIVSYVNFGHRNKEIYWPYNNVQTFDDFHKSLEHCFKIRRYFPTSHNWRHHEPNRKFIRAANMRINLNVPILSPILAVEYFFICSSHDSRSSEARP
jgi:SAM-dependent methyltransferase